MAVANNAVALENLKGAIVLGAQTLKSLELVNGGAVVAILTFYGNYIVRAPKVELPLLAYAMIVFGIGLFFAICASTTAYISQIVVATNMPEIPTSEAADYAFTAARNARSTRLLNVAIGLGLASLVAFCGGTVCASRALLEL